MLSPPSHFRNYYASALRAGKHSSSAVSFNSLETIMQVPKCLTFGDVVDALTCRRYRIAGVIGYNLVRNKLAASNRVRRSWWWAR
jgi:hypothetical protein